MTEKSRRSWFQCRQNAASNRSGGRKAVKMRSLVKLSLGVNGNTARSIPAATRPTL